MIAERRPDLTSGTPTWPPPPTIAFSGPVASPGRGGWFNGRPSHSLARELESTSYGGSELRRRI